MANKYPAKFIGAVKDRYEHRYVDLEYEYRGERYLVTKPLSWTACSSDYFYGDMRLTEQHRRAQESIDAKLDNPPIEYPKQVYEGSAQEGLDKFWNYINGDEHAFD